MARVEMLDVDRAVMLVDHAPEHAHALIHIVAQHMVRDGRQDGSLHVHLELLLRLGLVQTNGE